MSTNDLAISSELKVEHGSAEHGPGEVRDAAQLVSGKKLGKFNKEIAGNTFTFYVYIHKQKRKKSKHCIKEFY